MYRDALTGKVIKTEAVPNTAYHLQIANGHIYGLSNNGTNGVMQVYTLDGAKVAENNIPSAKVEGEKRDQIIAQASGVVWRWFSYSCPFMIDGDRIFIRGNDELWCVGSK